MAIYRNKNSKLDSKLNPLWAIHQECAKREHAKEFKGEWAPYVPTHFIYAFFTFNTLYNINWKKSIEDIKYFEGMTEIKKIEKYLGYCCSNEKFLSRYKEFFIKYIEHHCDIDLMFEELKKIKPDNKINGSLDEDTLEKFITACERCFTYQEFDETILNDIAIYIYKIRCNLFHGVKTLEDLQSPSQQIRLDIYSLFIIAINQMIFSYKSYQNGEVIGIAKLIEQLEWKQIKL